MQAGSPERGRTGQAREGAHLLIVGLHAEEDEVGCGTGQAALKVGAAPNLLGLRIEAVEGLHSLLKELPLDLKGEREQGARLRFYLPESRQSQESQR